MDNECLKYLISKDFFKQEPEKDFVTFIALRELMMSQLVLKNKWNISCLIPEYQNVDYRTLTTDINPTSNHGDPNYTNGCFNRTIHPYEVVFIKNNRLISNEATESLTVIKPDNSIKTIQSNILIYVLYHDDESYNIANKLKFHPWAKLHKLNTTKYYESYFFNNLLEKQDEWINKKYVGTFTYSIINKIPICNPNELAKLDYDVISFNNYIILPMIKQAEYSHPGFINIWSYILQKLGCSDYLSDEIPCYFNNYWMARPKLMIEYINFFKSVINIMETDSNLQTALNQNTGYKGNLTSQQLINISGKPYYTFHPFILERLPCYFFWSSRSTGRRGGGNRPGHVRGAGRFCRAERWTAPDSTAHSSGPWLRAQMTC